MELKDFERFFPELGEETLVFSKLERTFPVLFELTKSSPSKANGRIVVARTLSQAKGRFGRKWFAEEGGLWLGFSVFDEFLEATKCFLPLAVANSVFRACTEFGVISARIKWINDIHIDGKKLAGILIEKKEDWFLCGIGINVNNRIPRGIPGTSFKEVLKREVSCEEVLSSLIKWLRRYLGFLRYFDGATLREEEVENVILSHYKGFCDSIGRCVAYGYNLDRGDYIVGRVIDISSKGELVLKTAKGSLIFSSGEIIYLF